MQRSSGKHCFHHIGSSTSHRIIAIVIGRLSETTPPQHFIQSTAIFCKQFNIFASCYVICDKRNLFAAGDRYSILQTNVTGR